MLPPSAQKPIRAFFPNLGGEKGLPNRIPRAQLTSSQPSSDTVLSPLPSYRLVLTHQQPCSFCLRSPTSKPPNGSSTFEEHSPGTGFHCGDHSAAARQPYLPQLTPNRPPTTKPMDFSKEADTSRQPPSLPSRHSWAI